MRSRAFQGSPWYVGTLVCNGVINKVNLIDFIFVFYVLVCTVGYIIILLKFHDTGLFKSLNADMIINKKVSQSVTGYIMIMFRFSLC